MYREREGGSLPEEMGITPEEEEEAGKLEGVQVCQFCNSELPSGTKICPICGRRPDKKEALKADREAYEASLAEEGIYKTEEVETPDDESFEKVWVIVEERPDGEGFWIRLKGNVREGVNPSEVLPTPDTATTREEAIQKANALIEQYKRLAG